MGFTKIIYAISLLFCFVNIGFGQAPSIEWQKCYGGTNSDQAFSIIQTSDGGYITAGQSGSSDGDVSSNQGSFDYWIVKFQSNGIIEWQRSLGGSLTEQAKCIRQTTDGGYIVAGYAISNNGDVSGNHGTGTTDFWIVKLNTNGAVTWQKCYGGTSGEQARSIAETNDGGYIVAGSASSNDGDVAGNHGQSDCWVIKINAAGDLLWQKCYGGTASDIATSIQATTDGGFIMCCQSTSNDGDVSGNHGQNDYWVVKLDDAGNISWQKSFGGSDADLATGIQQTSDGGYVVAGYTVSLDGDVTNNHGSYDVWIVRLTNLGTMIWQRTYGGSSDEAAANVQQTVEGGFVISGATDSMDGDVTGLHGTISPEPDCWLIKISSISDIEWQKTLGGVMPEGAYDITQTIDGGFIMAGYTQSNNNGDVGTNHGGLDYWVVKLTPDPVPVKLSQLNAKEQLGSVICSWQTFQEQNSNRFVVERSDDGLNFTDMGIVTASGNSQVMVNYNFTDNTAFESGNENLYYRLRMVDNDGSFSYSNIAPVTLKYNSPISIFPNPATNQLHISFSSSQTYNAVIQITDASGKKILKENKIIRKGNNLFPVNISSLGIGSYILTVTGKSNYHNTFIKIKE